MNHIQFVNQQIAEFTTENPTLVGVGVTVAAVAAVALAVFSGIPALAALGIALAAIGIYAVVISIQHMRAERDRHNAQIQELEEQVGPLVQRVTELNGQVNGQVALIADLLQQNNQQVRPLNDAHYEIEEQNTAYDEALFQNQLADQLNPIRYELNALKTAAGNLSAKELRQKLLQVEQLQETIQQLTGDKSWLEKALRERQLQQLHQRADEGAGQQLKEMKSAVIKLEKQLKEKDVQVQQLMQENKNMLIQLKVTIEEKSTLENDLKTTELLNVRNLEDQLRLKTEALAERLEKAKQAKMIRDEMKKKIEELEKALAEFSHK